jgi:hypothetical protein
MKAIDTSDPAMAEIIGRLPSVEVGPHSCCGETCR